MTVHERNISASIDPLKLDRLAEVAIKVGLQLRPGQDLLVTAPAVALPLVRKVAEHAYRAGAGEAQPHAAAPHRMAERAGVPGAALRRPRPRSDDRGRRWP